MSTPHSVESAVEFFSNSAGRVFHHPAGYVRLVWERTPVKDAHVKALYEAAIGALEQFGLTRILSDHRHMPPISAGLQRWLVDEWLPAAVQRAGYRRVAVVQAFNLFNRLATNNVVSNMGNIPVEVSYFDIDQEAERWLLSDEESTTPEPQK